LYDIPNVEEVAQKYQQKVAYENELTPTSFRLGYHPALDGLRAVAVLSVMIYHTHPPYPLGGFIGVDIFFVLSGFLITLLIVKELALYHAFDFRRFYVRRALRLLPALLLLLTMYLVVVALFLDSSDKMQRIKDVLVVLFYSSNWVRALDLRTLEFLSHTWSLAAEEQFYLLWPIILVLLYRYLPSWGTRLGVVLLAAIAAWLLRVSLYVTGTSMERLYHGLDTHGDALLLGCALAIFISGVPVQSNRVVKQGLFWWAVLAAITGLFYISVTADRLDPLMIILGYFAVALFSATIILYVVQHKDSLLSRFLQRRELVWIGQISYGLYLWHYPIFGILRSYFYITDWRQLLFIGGILTFIAAAASFYLLERYFLGLKIKFGRNLNLDPQTNSK
jgi:peptidoglycan/LPS O-acetylase OafA/YrhL